MSDRRGAEFVMDAAQKGAVKLVELWVTDLVGALRRVVVPVAQLQDVLDDGLVVPASVVGLAEGGVSRVQLVPDPRSYAVLPFGDLPGGGRGARLFCDVQRLDGTPSPLDARAVLKRAIGRAADEGYAFYADAAVDHYYVMASADGRPQQQGAEPVAFAQLGSPGIPLAARTVLTETIGALEALGVAVTAFYEGASPGQHRVELGYADPLAFADGLVTHRRVVCEAARRRGVLATFMPFPFAAHARSALELAVALLDDGEPAFGSEEGGTAPAAGRFAAALADEEAALSLLARPTVNSYTRALDGVRVELAPQLHGADLGGTSVRLAVADAAANPYLLLAGVMAAGLRGVRDVTASTEAPASAPVVTLVQAADAARASVVVAETLGEPLLEGLVAVAYGDAAAYRSQVTAWEIARYLDLY